MGRKGVFVLITETQAVNVVASVYWGVNAYVCMFAAAGLGFCVAYIVKD